MLAPSTLGPKGRSFSRSHQRSVGAQARAFLQKVRHSPSNRTSVMFAISDSDAETTVALKEGSNFVVRIPLTESSINQNLRAAYGLILREHRRYFRCPVEVPVTLSRPGMTEIRDHAVKHQRRRDRDHHECLTETRHRSASRVQASGLRVYSQPNRRCAARDIRDFSLFCFLRR
jgi:hypothetical protein